MGTCYSNAQPKVVCLIFFVIEQFNNLITFPSIRATHELVALNGRLFAVGGTDGSSSLNSVEEFDVKTNKWTLVRCMISRRSSVAGAVLDCINLEHVLRQTRVLS